jgi:hypothetical protein
MAAVIPTAGKDAVMAANREKTPRAPDPSYETRRQRCLRLLREIARMRKQVHSYRARMSGAIEDNRRLCMECRHLIVASSAHLEQLHVSRMRTARRGGIDISAMRTMPAATTGVDDAGVSRTS